MLSDVVPKTWGWLQEVSSLQTKDVNLQTSTQARKAAIARTAETIQSTRVAVERTAREWRAGGPCLLPCT